MSGKCLSVSSVKNNKEKQPDLSSLLAYGDKVTMLDKLKTETEKDMQAISDAGERCDKPLWELHRLLHSDTECSDNEIQHTVNAVLAMGDKIVEQAKKRKEDGL